MTEIEPCPKCGALPCDWTDNPHTAPSGDVERAVMVCPQCEGEGGYPDGLDEAACHTECTRCGSNGWIVNQAAIAAMRPASGELAALCEALTPSGDTKAAYMGEFRFPFPVFNEDGEEVTMTPNVPWTTIKEIMAAIRNRASPRQAGEG